MYAMMIAASSGEQTVFVLFGCALFAALLFVYVFYQPATSIPAKPRRACFISVSAKRRRMRTCAI